ncbi:MAG: fibronectin type III domain-containing protein [Caldilineaceae bacterium]|nr:fibronectin type III domain-containing protein [Caldilineaceae bacterium]
MVDLAGNRLDGAIGRTVCRLVDTVTAFAIDYNKVRAAGNRLRPVWRSWTPPGSPPKPSLADPQIAASTAISLTLAWTPVAHQADDGYYERGYAPEITGPWTAAGRTADKAADGFVIDGLEPGRTLLRVRRYGHLLPHAARRPRWPMPRWRARRPRPVTRRCCFISSTSPRTTI